MVRSVNGLCQNRVAVHDFLDHTFIAAQETRKSRVRRTANLFDPERLLFAEAPSLNSQSISVKVVAGKAMKPEKGRATEMHGWAHPRRVTGQRIKLYEAKKRRRPACRTDKRDPDGSEKRKPSPFF